MKKFSYEGKRKCQSMVMFELVVNKSVLAAQDSRSTVQFNPPLFWTFFFFFGGGGVICFFGGWLIFFGGWDFFLLFSTVWYCTVQYITVGFFFTVQYSTQYSTVQYTVQYSTVEVYCLGCITVMHFGVYEIMLHWCQRTQIN